VQKILTDLPFYVYFRLVFGWVETPEVLGPNLVHLHRGSVGTSPTGRDREDNVMLEMDYPHPDSTWPDTQSLIKSELQHLTDIQHRLGHGWTLQRRRSELSGTEIGVRHVHHSCLAPARPHVRAVAFGRAGTARLSAVTARATTITLAGMTDR
jgi:hypothetical protein